MGEPDVPAIPDYFRRDQKDGISPPDLSKECTFAEHIVHARGKRTQFTSVSLDLSKLRDFGECDYRLEQEPLFADGHELVEHGVLIDSLRTAAREGEKAERLRAAQALRYATRRKEGLVRWAFDFSRVARKDLIKWAGSQVQAYFSQVK
jgi:hypothetical protein